MPTESSLRVLRGQALRNTSAARRHAAKLYYRFGPLTPSARSANLIVGDGTKNGFPTSNKEPPTNQKHYLTEKAPYKFESIFLGPRHRSLTRRSPRWLVPHKSRARRNRRCSSDAEIPLRITGHMPFQHVVAKLLPDRPVEDHLGGVWKMRLAVRIIRLVH